MFTSSWRALKLDSVLFVERSGELRYIARLSTRKVRSQSESESKKGDELYAVDPKPGDLPMDRLKPE